MHGRRVVTEVGPALAALGDADRTARLFDLGLRSPYFDSYLRASEQHQLRRPREGAGLSLFDSRHGLPFDITAMSLHRAFVSELGRIRSISRVPVLRRKFRGDATRNLSPRSRQIAGSLMQHHQLHTVGSHAQSVVVRAWSMPRMRSHHIGGPALSCTPLLRFTVSARPRATELDDG